VSSIFKTIRRVADLTREHRTDGVVYYESIKREINIRLIYECRCDERLKAKDEGSTRLDTLGCAGTGTPKDRDEFFFFYYESRKRELKTRLIYEDRCDERLKN
jgi:hypothetical protein